MDVHYATLNYRILKNYTVYCKNMIEFDNMELFNLIWRDIAKGIYLLVLKIKSLTETYRHSHTYRHSFFDKIFLVKYIYFRASHFIYLITNSFYKGKMYVCRMSTHGVITGLFNFLSWRMNRLFKDKHILCTKGYKDICTMSTFCITE